MRARLLIGARVIVASRLPSALYTLMSLPSTLVLLGSPIDSMALRSLRTNGSAHARGEGGDRRAGGDGARDGGRGAPSHASDAITMYRSMYGS